MKKLVLGASLAASLSACHGAIEIEGTPRGAGALSPLSAEAKFVVRHGDYTSSAFSFLDENGEVVDDTWIHSGSTPPGLTALLSGDTDVPTRMERGVFTILDRYGVDVVTRIDMRTGDVLGQVRTQGSSSSAFSSNPNDVAYVSATSAWVTRYSHNTMPGVDADVQGSDLIEFDPSTMLRTGARVDLSPLSVDVPVYPVSGPPTSKPARVRPHNVILVGGYMAVGLDLLTDGFESAAPGKLAIVDAGSRAVTSFDLAPLTNCGSLQLVPGTTDHIAVTCKGWYEYPTPASGVVVVRLDGSTGVATEIGRYAQSAFPSDDGVFDAVQMLDDDEFLGVHLGGYGPTDPPDDLVLVNIGTGARTTIFTSAHASDLLVTMAYDAATGLVLMPDKSVGIRRMHRSASGAITNDSVISLRGHGLPAVSVTLLP